MTRTATTITTEVNLSSGHLEAGEIMRGAACRSLSLANGRGLGWLLGWGWGGALSGGQGPRLALFRGEGEGVGQPVSPNSDDSMIHTRLRIGPWTWPGPRRRLIGVTNAGCPAPPLSANCAVTVR